MLNFAKPEVVEHLFEVIDRLLTENEIAFLKWDMNRHISEPGWSGAARGREREIWVRHVQGVYSLIDRLRGKHPEVLWENCSGGGGRADIGMLARMDQTWASDNTDPLDRLRIQYGYTHAFAAKTMVGWVTDNPDMMNKRSTPMEFAFRVASTGTLGIGGNLTKWTDEEIARAKFHVGQYKRFRDLVQHGELYRIGAPDAGVWGFHYVDREKQKAVAYLFVEAKHFGEEPEFRIPGLRSDKRYKVVQQANGISGKARELPNMSGEALAERGIKLGMKGSMQSAVVSMEVME
jgi:alpha-galactosidase